MKDLLYHALVGNDTPPWVVAGARGILEAALAAGMIFFVNWEGDDSTREMIKSFATPFIAVLGLRFFGEGFLDTWKRYR